jgi:glycosyltransferase involved in cell wall biosynthesis
MKVLFIVPYPVGLSPSQRFRFEQYLGILQGQGHTYEIHSFLFPHNWRLFADPGNITRKIGVLLIGYLRRFALISRAGKFDRVFIHREAAPLGPPLIEWLISKVLRKKVIYDFDDAIWLTDRVDESLVEKLLRQRGKVPRICSMSHKISAGNAYLASYARMHNEHVIINPTTIDTAFHRQNKSVKRNAGHITIGWTGSSSTLKYLSLLARPMTELTNKYPHIRFVVIADRRPKLSIPSFGFIKWTPNTEIEDLQQLDIGLMPLPDDEWSKGKCGFKALQYMSLGIPTIASPVGVNNEIITHGVNGLLASSEDEWISAIELLLHDAHLRKRLGQAGMETVANRYSVSSNAERFLSLFEEHS